MTILSCLLDIQMEKTFEEARHESLHVTVGDIIVGGQSPLLKAMGLNANYLCQEKNREEKLSPIAKLLNIQKSTKIDGQQQLEGRKTRMMWYETRPVSVGGSTLGCLLLIREVSHCWYDDRLNSSNKKQERTVGFEGPLNEPIGC